MTLHIRASSFVTVRYFPELCNHWKVLGDFEPFPGGHISMVQTVPGELTRHYWGGLESVILNRQILQVSNPVVGHPIPIGEPYVITDEELEFLREVDKLIDWGQENSYWLEVDANPQLAEVKINGKQQLPTELTVSPI